MGNNERSPYLIEHSLIQKAVKLTIFVLIMGVLSFIFVFISQPSNISRGSESSITLSGRDELWQGAWIMFQQQPILGYGYGVEAKIWEGQNLFSMEDRFFIASAQQPLHNGFISIAVGTGIVGLSIWLYILFLPIQRSRQNKSENMVDYKAFIMVSITMILITNLTESFLTGYHTFGDIVFWFSWIIANKIPVLNNSETTEA